MSPTLLRHLAGEIASVTGKSFTCHASPVGGGCINQAAVLSDDERKYFVKLNHAGRADMFSAELLALQELAKTKSVRVPSPICHGVCGEYAYLVLEHIPLRGLDEPSAAVLGEQLARMHRHTASSFGWHRDNTIGTTPQHNDYRDSWPVFWRTHRLDAMTAMLESKASTHTIDLLYRLAEMTDAFFQADTPVPSLLHGDLWGGNVARDATGAPVIFDPASYYGDRETDIAMTELFGQLPESFYAAYKNHWPLADGYHLRRDFYNLYHVLNHALLFGGGYESQALEMAQSLLAATA